MFQKNGHQQVGQSEEKPIHPPRQSTDDLGPFPSDPRPSWAPLSKEEIMMMQDVLFWVWLRVSLLLFLVLVWLGLLAGAVLVTVQSLEPSPILRWWQRSVFYQVEVDVFQDSNGDGIGGLNGVVEGLSYLQALSVNALILCPVYKRDPNVPRPNLTAIADLYSSPDHFTNLVSEAGKHGIKILLDIAGAEGLDLNCTSPPPSQYANNISSTVRSTEQERWSLNTTGCEDVGVRRMCCARDDQAETLEFWLKQGVSGFQIHTSGELQAKEMIDVWRQLIEERLGEERTERVLVLVTDAVYEDLVCHGWAGSETASDVLFRYDPFPITGNLSARDLAETVLKYSVTTQRDWAVGPTVGYLTSVAGDLHGLFTVLMLSLPGVPFINCGDEIGRVELQTDFRNFLQRPPVMQCSNSIPNMTGRPWLPDFLRPIPAEPLTRGNRSMLNLYRLLRELKSREQAMAYGNFTLLSVTSDLLSFLRQWSCGRILVILNLSSERRDFTWPARDSPGEALVLASSDLGRHGPLNLTNVTLGPREGLVLKVLN